VRCDERRLSYIGRGKRKIVTQKQHGDTRFTPGISWPAFRCVGRTKGAVLGLAVGGLAVVTPSAVSAHTVVSAPSKAAVKRAMTVVEVIKPSSKMASDGQMYDAFRRAFIKTYVGQRVTVTFKNYDTAQHSFTVPQLGINEIFKGAARAGAFTTKTVTLAFSRAGTYHWRCVFPCDGYSMKQQGYMTGTITVLR